MAPGVWTRPDNCIASARIELVVVIEIIVRLLGPLIPAAKTRLPTYICRRWRGE